MRGLGQFSALSAMKGFVAACKNLSVFYTPSLHSFVRRASSRPSHRGSDTIMADTTAFHLTLGRKQDWHGLLGWGERNPAHLARSVRRPYCTV